jgi:hypothetical protein
MKDSIETQRFSMEFLGLSSRVISRPQGRTHPHLDKVHEGPTFSAFNAPYTLRMAHSDSELSMVRLDPLFGFRWSPGAKRWSRRDRLL